MSYAYLFKYIIIGDTGKYFGKVHEKTRLAMTDGAGLPLKRRCLVHFDSLAACVIAWLNHNFFRLGEFVV